MRVPIALHLVVAAIAAAQAVVYGQPPADSPAQVAPAPERALTVDEIVQRALQAENVVITNMRTWRPMVEVYIQNLEQREDVGLIPVHDTYFLGRFDWRDGPRLQPLRAQNEAGNASARARQGGVEYLPDGFAAMAAPDWTLLDVAKYEINLIRREFVGEVRTFVLDVKPRRNTNDGFTGRIWVEDRGYNIVRYNGINRKVERTLFKKRLPFHVDGWRVNVMPGLWLPSYVYCEETDLGDISARAKGLRFKSNVRFWGFDPMTAAQKGQFTSIQIAEDVRDSAQPGQLTPAMSQRRWEQEAEVNLLERLTGSGLMAPPGEVEKVLDTVLNNLLVTNEIALDRPVKARVLLPSPLESFTVGHTIVLSRGLIDVLPNEASLAMMLAHELGHIVLGHSVIDTRFAFADRIQLNDLDLLKLLKITRSAREEAAADAKMAEMLQKSPYAEKLGEAKLFLAAVAARAAQLPNLIQPHIGEHLSTRGAASPAPAPGTRADAPAALPLGARLVLDPWSGRLELLRTTAALSSASREDGSLAITPLIPYLKYAQIAADAR